MFDEAVTRLRPNVQSIQKAHEQTIALAEAFTTRKQYKQVFAAVEAIMTSDSM
ncbi:MAG: hypothetical protein ACREDS_14955 [Limisphaerales bacterium]